MRRLPIIISSIVLVGFIGISIYALKLGWRNLTLTGQNQSLSLRVDALEKSIQSSRQKHLRQKKALFSAFSRLKKQDDLLKKQLDNIQQTLESASEEKIYLEDVLIHKTKEIESLSRQVESETSNSASAPQPPASVQELESRLQQKNAELAQATEQNKILSRKLDRLYKAANDKIAEINVAKITLEDTVSKARQAIENEWKTVDLGSISASSDSSKPRAARKEGKVLAVNPDHGFVVVDLGKVDGVKIDTVLTIDQDGSPLTLTVLEVRDLMTACNITQMAEARKIQINDSVRIGK